MQCLSCHLDRIEAADGETVSLLRYYLEDSAATVVDGTALGRILGPRRARQRNEPHVWKDIRTDGDSEPCWGGWAPLATASRAPVRRADQAPNDSARKHAASPSGGEGGIRTLGTGVSPYNGLAILDSLATPCNPSYLQSH
jgi:hypothetical protein